jgi:RhoGAP domain
MSDKFSREKKIFQKKKKTVYRNEFAIMMNSDDDDDENQDERINMLNMIVMLPDSPIPKARGPPQRSEQTVEQLLLDQLLACDDFALALWDNDDEGDDQLQSRTPIEAMLRRLSRTESTAGIVFNGETVQLDALLEQKTFRKRVLRGLQRRGHSTSASEQSVSLQSLASKSERLVPQLVDDCIDVLDTEQCLSTRGLFRISGRHDEVKRLQAAYASGEGVDLSSVTDVHVVATLLKAFFLQLGEPAFTFAMYTPLHACYESAGGVAGKCRKYRHLLREMPAANRATLQRLFQFLARVAQRSADNAMTESNLGIVFSPTLLRSADDTHLLDRSNASIIEELIVSSELIFGATAVDLSTIIVSPPSSPAAASSSSSGTKIKKTPSSMIHSAVRSLRSPSKSSVRSRRPLSKRTLTPLQF